MPQKLKNNKQLINHLKPYPKYKDSGVEWLGMVPDGWKVLPNRTLFREVKNINHPDEEMLSVTISSGVILQSSLLSNSSKKDSSNEDKTKYKLVEIGDIAYNKMRAWQGAIGISKYRGIVSPAYIIHKRRRAINNDYYHSLFRTPYFAKEAERWSYGITSDQWSLRTEHFKMIYSLMPSQEEQTAIVFYLKYISSRINTYIAAKKKLVKLLEEQKQAIIHQAVTGTIDVTTGKPYPKYKESGVEWLGQVPTDWQVEKLKQSVISCVNGIWGGEPNGDDDIFCVRVADFDKTLNKVVLSNMTYRAVTQAERSSRLLKNGGLLIEKSGGGELQPVGNVVLFDHNIPAVCSNFIGKMTVANGYDPEFLCYLHSALYSIGLNVRSIKQTTGIQNLDIHSYLNEYVAFPSITGQTAIVHYLKKTLFVISKSIDIAKQEINLLHEYKTRLTADVVTGKVDVREMTLL